MQPTLDNDQSPDFAKLLLGDDFIFLQNALIAYMPYGVRVKTNLHKFPNNYTIILNYGHLAQFATKDRIIIPILNPMCDLENFFNKLFGKVGFEDVTELLDEDYLLKFNDLRIYEIDNTCVEYLPYGTVQLLLKYNFDLFGLIDKGLAVSIHNVGQVVA